ncbi:UNVERIFIED_CONTAM: hypothetical protein Sindi_1386200 [Sesamum indicum]
MGSGALVLAAERQVGRRIFRGRNFAHWWSHAASSLCTRSSPRAPRRGQLGLPRWATFRAQISPFSVDSGAFSIVGRIRDESAVGSQGEIYRGWGVRNGREKAGKLDGSEEHFAKRGATRGLPRGTLNFGVLMGSVRCISAGMIAPAEICAALTFYALASGATGGTSNLPGGVTLRTGGATPRAAYAREARRELHDVDTGLAPVVPHFVAQISPVSVDSGAFSIVGRIRDESAVGSQGEIYRVGVCGNGREKAGSWTGRRSISQKRGATRGLPRGSPILVLLSPKHA